MGPEEKAKVWKEFMSSPLAKVVYTAYYNDNYERKGNMEIGEYIKRHSIEAIVHTSEMMNLLVQGYEARTLAEKPKEESQMGPKGDPQWLDNPNHPKDGSEKLYWIKFHNRPIPESRAVFWDGEEWLYRKPDGSCPPLNWRKVKPI
jgi:hypothetical protein